MVFFTLPSCRDRQFLLRQIDRTEKSLSDSRLVLSIECTMLAMHDSGGNFAASMMFPFLSRVTVSAAFHHRGKLKSLLTT